mmetsp:Transcript_74813/g.173336  ORF Transcript_74813/g.173336 Transcript_74813/m.173336 type:complete len:230 (+) Transcript_74813:338-1027(+)
MVARASTRPFGLASVSAAAVVLPFLAGRPTWDNPGLAALLLVYDVHEYDDSQTDAGSPPRSDSSRCTCQPAPLSTCQECWGASLLQQMPRALRRFVSCRRVCEKSPGRTQLQQIWTAMVRNRHAPTLSYRRKKRWPRTPEPLPRAGDPASERRSPCSREFPSPQWYSRSILSLHIGTRAPPPPGIRRPGRRRPLRGTPRGSRHAAAPDLADHTIPWPSLATNRGATTSA